LTRGCQRRREFIRKRNRYMLHSESILTSCVEESCVWPTGRPQCISGK
jgi:hypothetical protein